MQLNNLGPLIKASELWLEEPNKDLWIENDNGKMMLATKKPTNLFAKILKVEKLSNEEITITEPVIELEWPSGKHSLFLPKQWDEEAPYTGRPYILGKYDCYSLVKDWMFKEKNIQMETLTDTPERLANQFLTDGAFVTNKEIHKWNKVAIPQIGDGILFAMTQENEQTPGIASHAGVYIGNNKFLHHFANRLSCETYLDNFWKSRVATFMRWKG